MKLTLGAKYDREIEKAFQPIGDYVVNSMAQHSDGSTEIVHTSTLKEKLDAFETYHLNEFKEIKALELQWEKIVGEIYKTGISCLGEEAMRAFLIEPKTSPLSSPLFVPDHESVPSAPKKRVTFQELRPEYPAFLSGPSMYQNRPIAALPTLPEEEIWRLEDAVGDMGVKQVEDLEKIEMEQTKWWNKKCEQIAQTLKAD